MATLNPDFEKPLRDFDFFVRANAAKKTLKMLACSKTQPTSDKLALGVSPQCWVSFWNQTCPPTPKTFELHKQEWNIHHRYLLLAVWTKSNQVSVCDFRRVRLCSGPPPVWPTGASLSFSTLSGAKWIQSVPVVVLVRYVGLQLTFCFWRQLIW